MLDRGLKLFAFSLVQALEHRHRQTDPNLCPDAANILAGGQTKDHIKAPVYVWLRATVQKKGRREDRVVKTEGVGTDT